MCVCVRQCVFVCFSICKYFGRTVLYVCIEYCIQVNMYHVSVQGIDKHVINVHYYYYVGNNSTRTFTAMVPQK